TALTYQWRLDALPIPGATHATLTLPAVALSDTGDYSVIVTGPAGGVGSATFSVGVSGTPPLGFRWRRNGLTVANRINDPTFTITNAQLSHAGIYNVAVTNALNATPGIISSDAVLTVLRRP